MSRQMILTDDAGAAQPDSIPPMTPPLHGCPPWHGNADRHAAPATLQGSNEGKTCRYSDGRRASASQNRTG